MPKDYSQYIIKKPDPVDERPFWIRLLASIRPKISIIRDKKSDKFGVKVEVSGGTDF